MDLLIEVGVQAIQSALSESVDDLCGERYCCKDAEAPRHWGRQPGELVLGRRRVRVMRATARQARKELTIPAHAAF